MTSNQRIYLDNAATSWPKPESVTQTLQDFYQNIGCSAGRGSSKVAVDLQANLDSSRKLLADFIHAKPQEIIFSNNGTAALNQAILGLLKPGDHVITTQLEHNSVLRPLRFLETKRNVSLTIVQLDETGNVSPQSISDAVQENTRLIVVNHASNVLGNIQPIKEIASIAKEHDVAFLIDAAQTLGHIDIDVGEIGCDMLAAPGHKSLMGPLGCGILFIRENLADEIEPVIFGGTGTQSESDLQPTELPTKFESGNMNAAALLGLKAGLEFVISEEGKALNQVADEIRKFVWNEMRDVEGITVYGQRNDVDRQVNLFSFTVDGMDSHEVAGILDSSFGIECRAGFHCAPLVHQFMGTEKSGGAVRISWGLFNTLEEMKIVVNAIKEIAATNIF